MGGEYYVWEKPRKMNNAVIIKKRRNIGGLTSFKLRVPALVQDRTDRAGCIRRSYWTFHIRGPGVIVSDTRIWTNSERIKERVDEEMRERETGQGKRRRSTICGRRRRGGRVQVGKSCYRSHPRRVA